MTLTEQVRQYILALPKDGQVTAREVAAAYDMTSANASAVLQRMVRQGGLAIRHSGHGRNGNVYVIADPSLVEYPVSRREPGAQESSADDATAAEHLTFAVDHDGDLQIIRPDGSVTMIDNQNARRLVAFVALQATAILTVGA